MVGGSSLGIGLTLFLRDQFSGPAARIKNSSRELQQQFQMMEDQLRYQRNLNAGLAFGGAMVLRGFGRQIKKAADYRYEMEFVKSITAANTAEQKQLAKTAETLAGKTMFYPQDIAEGMRFMAMAGMDAEQVLHNISGAVNLAGATMSQLGGKGGAADIMTNVMKQFGIDFKDTISVADKLAYGVTRANTNLFDLGEALKYSGATAMDLNVTLDESVAMVMALGNAGMQGSMAGVAMENAMRYMARAFSDFASGPSRKALAEIGLTVTDVTDQAGNLLSMTEIMTRFGNAIDQNFGSGMNVQKQAILQNIFGVRGKRAGSLFLRNLKEFQKFSGDVASQSIGHSGRIMEDMMSTFKGEMDKLISEFQSMWIAITTAIEPVGKAIVKVLRVITKALSFTFKIPFLGEFLAGGVIGFVAIRTAAFAYTAVVKGLQLLHMQAKHSAINMSTSGIAGWNAMSAAAARYAGIVKSGAISEMVGAGMIRGLTLNKAGRIVAQSSKTGMKTFVSGAAAAGVMTGASRVVGGKVIANTAGRFALGKLVGILGGPLGMALSFILPAAITAMVRAFKGNKDSLDKNTDALNKKGESAMSIFSGQSDQVMRFTDLQAPALQVVGAAASDRLQNNLMQENMAYYQKQLTDILNKEMNQTIVINVAGEEQFRQTIERYMFDNVDRIIGQ